MRNLVKISGQRYALLLALGLFTAFANPAFALNIGYYTLLSPSSTTPATTITNGGHAPVQITTLSGADLSSLDVLWVLNPNNYGYSSDYTSNLSVVDNFIKNGGGLLFHDRHVTTAATAIPGASGVSFHRAPGANIDIAAGAEALAAQMGITNTSLDGGNWSYHGYADLASLPATAVPVLTTGIANQIVDFNYSYGAGSVYYSSIPIDHYIGFGGNLNFSQYIGNLVDAVEETVLLDNLIVNNSETHELSGSDQTYEWVRLLDGEIVDSAATKGLLTADSGYDVRLGSISANLAGSALTKTTSGLVTLSGNNSYTGGTLLNDGSLSVSSDSNLGDASGALNFDGGTLQITGTTLNSTARTINWGSGGGGFDVADAGNMFTVSQVLSGSGGLTKEGDGTLALSGANTYTGGTAINGGIIQVSADNNLGGGNISYNSGTLQYAAFFDTAKNMALESLGGTIDTNGYDSTASGVIAGDGSLTKEGAGTLALSGANTYTGGTAINGGTVQVGADNNLGTGDIAYNSGTLQYSASFDTAKNMALESLGGTIDTNGYDSTASGVIAGDGSLTKEGTGNLTLTGNNSYSGGTTVSAGVLTGNTDSLQGDIVNNAAVVFDQAVAGTYADVMSGSGSLTKSNSGTLSLSGTNSYSGGTAINGGTIQLGANNNLGSGNISYNSGTLSLTGSLTIANDMTLESLGGTIVTGTNHSTLSGDISGSGSLTKEGTWNLTMSGNNSYSGGTNINGGAVVASAANNLGTGNITYNGGRLEYGASFDLNKDMLLYSGGGSIVTNGYNSAIFGVISGDGSLTKYGDGTLTLSGSNTYTGLTHISGGTLQTGKDEVLYNSAWITLGPGGTFDLNDNTERVGLVNGNGLVDIGSGHLITGGLDVGAAYGGVFIGDGTLTKEGDSTWGLTGDHNSFTGTLNINQGRINLFGSNESIYNGLTLNVGDNSAATLDIKGRIETVGSVTLVNGTLEDGVGGGELTAASYDLQNGTVNAALGAGTLSKTTANTVVLNGTTDAEIIYLKEGTLQLNDSERLDNSSAVHLQGGSLDLQGYDETVGYIDSSSSGGTIDGTRTLQAGYYGFGGTNTTVNANLGTNSLYQWGGTTVLNGTKGSGWTQVSAGTLKIGANERLDDESMVSVSTGSLDLNGKTETVTGISLNTGGSLDDSAGNGLLIAGTYGLTDGTVNVDLGGGLLRKVTAGTVVLNSSTLAETVTIEEGTLQLGQDEALYNMATLTVSGGSLNLNGYTETVNSAVLSGGTLDDTVGSGQLTAETYNLQSGVVNAALGAGAITKTTFGTVVLNAATLASTVDVQAGILQLDEVDVLDNLAALSVTGGSLDLNGFTETVNSVVLGSGSLDDSAGAGQLIAETYELQSGAVNVALGAGAITKTNIGTVTLNAVTLGTTVDISGGILQLAENEVIYNTAAVTVNNGTLDLNDYTETIGSLAGSGNVDLGAGALTVGVNNTDTNFDGVISGTGSVTKVGLGTIVLAGKNLYSGNTTVADGTLQTGASEVLYNSGVLNIVTGGSFDVNGNDETVGTVALVDGTLDDSAGGGLLTAASYRLTSGTVNAALGEGSLVTGGGTVVLNGTSESSIISLNTGTLQLGASERLHNSATLIPFGGTLDLQGFDETIGQIAGSSFGLTLNGTGTLQANSYSMWNAVINANLGTGTLRQSNGTTILNGSKGSGDVNIVSGLLQTGNNEVIYNSSAVTVTGSGLLDINDHTETIGSLAGDGSVDLGTGSLTTGGNDTSTTFAGTISGAGDLNKMGAGVFDMTGDNSFVGTTTIYNGALMVNGTLASHVMNMADGLLGGSGTIAGNVTNYGTLAPGNSIGTLTVGNYNSAIGSIFEVEVDADGNSDQIATTGTATINGGTVEVLALGDVVDYNRRTIYNVVTADGGVAGSYEGVTVDLAELTPFLAYDDPDLVELILVRNDINLAEIAAAETENQKSVAAVLTKASLTTFDGDLAEVLDVFVDELDEAGRRAALDELGGQKLHTALPTAAFGLIESFQGAVGSRMSRLHQANQQGMAQIDPLDGVQLAMAGDITDLGPLDSKGQQDQNLWVHMYGVNGDVDKDENAAGYDYDLYGAAFGLDFPVTSRTNLGLTVGYGTADVKTELNDVADIESVQVGLYSNYENQAFYLDGLVSYADNSYDTTREITVGSITETATADYDGSEWAIAGEMGYIGTAGEYNVQPFFGTRWLRLDEDGFTEKGAGSLSLRVDARTAYSWKIFPGLRISRPVKTGEQSYFIPQASMKLIRELRDNNDTVSASFAGAPSAGSFQVEGVDIDRSSIELGAGFKVLDKGTLQVNLDVTTEINDERTAHSVNGGFKLLW